LPVTPAAVLASGAVAAKAAGGPPGSTEVFHTGVVMGHDSKNEAVHCADLLATGQLDACLAIHESVGFGAPGHTFAEPEQICGASFGHSACGAMRNFHFFTSEVSAPSGGMTGTEWAESVHDSIVLRSGATFSSPVVATPHFSYPCV
jgi:hypothetical protein